MTREKKVGLFVVVGLAITVAAVLVIGENRHVWDSKVTYTTVFDNVAGLRAGAPVRMGGVDIGDVTRVGYSDDVKDARIHVRMRIVKSEAIRVRDDTIATVANKGLLGDKMLELSVGAGAEFDPKNPIASREPADLFGSINSMSGDAKETLVMIKETARTLSDPQLAQDVKGSVKDLHTILDGVANKDSVAHRLLFDAAEAQKLDATLTNLEAGSANLAAVSADMRDVSGRVKTGPGLAHALVYDGDMAANASGSLAELHKDLEAIRTGNGLVHAFVYGDTDTQHVMTNVNAMSDDLRVIVSNLRAGKGTLGALLVDPSVYEDIKSLIGNVERNQVLRALVRYSIKADENKTAPATSPIVK